MNSSQAKQEPHHNVLFNFKNNDEWTGRRVDDDWYVSDLYAMIKAFIKMSDEKAQPSHTTVTTATIRYSTM